jgi:uncharacterized protein YxeA
MKKIMVFVVALLVALSIGASVPKTYTYKFYNPRTNETITVVTAGYGLSAPMGYIQIAPVEVN